MNKLGLYISSAMLALLLMSSTIFVVDQRQFGVVYSLGQIKKVITEPGLNFKLPPPFQNVNFIDKRLLTLDNVDSEPMLTAEKQRVVIDWYVRWRITDPMAYIRNVGLDEKSGANQLNRVVRNAFQEEINKRTVKDLLSLSRDVLMNDVKREVLEKVRGEKPWGVDVVDVRITRADYVDAITESVYRRMEAERKRVANELRSTGAAEGEKIRADADRQREVTIANAYRDAQKIKGQGDAQAARIYGEAFGRDPQFAQFYRSLEAYKATFSKKSDPANGTATVAGDGSYTYTPASGFSGTDTFTYEVSDANGGKATATLTITAGTGDVSFVGIVGGAAYTGSDTGALGAVTAAVVGVILNLSVWFALQVSFGTVLELRMGLLTFWLPQLASVDLRVIVIATLSAILIWRFKLALGWVLMGAAGFGLLFDLLV